MLKVKSWQKSKEYFEVALAPLGYTLLKDGGTWGGFHVPGKTQGQIYVKQGTFKCDRVIACKWCILQDEQIDTSFPANNNVMCLSIQE
jgi:hypothetical protein